MSSHKGKGRATEQTPLLAGDHADSYASTSNDSASVEAEHSPNTPTSPHSILRTLRTVFLSTLSICIIVAGILALLAWSYANQASKISSEQILDQALVLRGPDSLDVLNVTEDGDIWLRVGGRIGLDAGAVMGVHDDRQNDGFFTLVWKSFGRWGIRRVDRVSVNLDTFNITSRHHIEPRTLATIRTVSQEVPLTDDPPHDDSWLTSMSTSVLISPTNNTQDLLDFVKDSWRSGHASIGAAIPRVTVHGGGLGDDSWRSRFRKALTDVRTSVRLSIPAVPGFPQPGKNVPFPNIGDLITLQSFEISTNGDALSLYGEASVLNPAPPTINLTAPPIPFVISLPSNGDSSDTIPIASVDTLPFTLTHPNITVRVTGHVLPLSSSPTARQSLSSFLGRFLSAQSNPILITTPLIPDLPPAPAIFPALDPPPNVLRNVTIDNMKMKPTTSPSGKTIFYASGLVKAHVVLPKGFDVEIDVRRVLPDVMVFDGEVPEKVEPLPVPVRGPNDDLPAPPAPPLPDPLPERAFGRIRPEYWLNSNSTPDLENDGSEGSAYLVTAFIDDVPMDILPGRENQFSKFVQKVIFGNDGALAGLLGSASVKVQVYGLPIDDGHGGTPDMNLGGLPFRGAVRVGRKGILASVKESLVRWLRLLDMQQEAQRLDEAKDNWRREVEAITKRMRRRLNL